MLWVCKYADGLFCCWFDLRAYLVNFYSETNLKASHWCLSADTLQFYIWHWHICVIVAPVITALQTAFRKPQRSFVSYLQHTLSEILQQWLQNHVKSSGTQPTSTPPLCNWFSIRLMYSYQSPVNRYEVILTRFPIIPLDFKILPSHECTVRCNAQ